MNIRILILSADNLVSHALFYELTDLSFEVDISSSSIPDGDYDVYIIDKDSFPGFQPNKKYVNIVFSYTFESDCINDINVYYFRRPFEMSGIIKIVEKISSQCNEEKNENDLIVFGKNSVIYNKRKIALSDKEYLLLKYLYENRGNVLSREDILNNIWREGAGGNVVEVYINYLRNKLEENGEKRIIQTVHKKGYIIR